MSKNTEILIIGAGPYGISLAYDLFMRAIDFVIVGHPFSLWQNHTMSKIRLRSDRHASQIYSRDGRFDLRKFLKGKYSKEQVREFLHNKIPMEVFQDYLQWVVSQLPFGLVEEKITMLEEGGQGFVAVSESGTKISARKVILATGIEAHHTLPQCLADLGSDHVVHSLFPKIYETYQQKRLLVVGGGQAAGEAILHLSKNNTVTWLYRSPLIFFSEPLNLPKPLFLLLMRFSRSFRFMPKFIHRKLAKIFVRPTITPDLKDALLGGDVDVVRCDVADIGLAKRGDCLSAATLEKTFDKVIAATGYRYSLKSLSFLSPELLAKVETKEGVPRLRGDFSTSVARLYMVGGITEPSFGPAMRFMAGARHATSKLGKVLARGR